jgi:hypothetical protein
MNFYLLPAVEFGPCVIRRLIDLLPADRLDTRLDPERFTPREIVAHLADWEPIMRERIRTAVSNPGTTIPAYDETQMALDHGYAESDPWEQAELFRRERQITAGLLHSFRAEDWGMQVIHPERGAQSAEDLANALLGHDLYHIEQLSAYFGKLAR